MTPNIEPLLRGGAAAWMDAGVLWSSGEARCAGGGSSDRILGQFSGLRRRNVVISLPPTWRLVLLVAAVVLLPALVFVQWLVRQLARSYLGARLRGWWRS